MRSAGVSDFICVRIVCVFFFFFINASFIVYFIVWARGARSQVLGVGDQKETDLIIFFYLSLHR